MRFEGKNIVLVMTALHEAEVNLELGLLFDVVEVLFIGNGEVVAAYHFHQFIVPASASLLPTFIPPHLMNMHHHIRHLRSTIAKY